MGTKVQCKSYLPGYHSMGNLNEDTNSSWYYEDKTLSGHLYKKDFMLKPANGYSDYDKEMLKRTMLEHEAIFRKQVYELHRLYRIQKDLMDEFKMKELYSSSVPMDTSLSNLYSSHLSSEVTEKRWQMPQLTTGNTNYNWACVASANEMRPPLDFLKENGVPSIPSINGPSLKDDDLLNSKLTKFPQKMFDLHLPADLYINNDAERAEKENVADSSLRATVPLNTIHGLEPENDVKITPRFGENPICRKDSWKSDSHLQNGMPIHNLADLNEPIKNIFCEGDPGIGTTPFRNVQTNHEGMQRKQFPSCTSHLHRDIHGEEKACSNFFSEDKDETRHELPLFHNEVGQSRRDTKSCNPGFSILPISSKPAQLTQIVIPDQNKTKAWFGDKTSNDIEIFGSSPHLANSAYSGPTVQSLSPFEVLPHSDYSSTASPVSYRRNPIKRTTHVPIAVQALPCFNGSTATNAQSKSSCVDVQNLGDAFGKWQCNRKARLNPTSGSEISSPLNGFHHGFPSNSNISADLQFPNLNSHGDKSVYGNFKVRGSSIDASSNRALTNAIKDDFAAQQDARWNHVEVPGGVSCSASADVEKRVLQMESGFSSDYSRLMSSYNTAAPEIKKNQEKEKGRFMSALQDLPSSLYSNKIGMQRILGFPILDKVHQTATCSPSTSGKDIFRHTDLSNDFKVPSSAKLNSAVKGVRSSSKGLRNRINLNSVISCLDIPNSSENSPDGEAVVPSPLPVRSPSGKLAPEADGHQKCARETLARVAAENLVAMSLDVRCGSIDSTRPSIPDSCDSLQWLAEIASSNTESAKASDGGGCGVAESSDDDGLDYFESMTLKLEEMKADEYWNRPQEQDDRNDGKTGSTSLLLTRPRRGQGRKRRQRRDFQKDILPGLASLSRNEVTEDLQAIGGLMRGSCRASQAGLLKRNSSGNRFPCQARWRRRPRSLTVTVAEIRVNPAPTQRAEADSGLVGRSVMGWGRTTRRGRRPRVPSGNASAVLT